LKIALYDYTLTFKKPFFFKTGKVLHKKGLLVCIDSHWGEIAPLEGFSKESYEEARSQTLQICDGNLSFPLLPSVAFGFCSALNHPPHTLKQRSSSLGISPFSKCAKIKMHKFSIDRAISEIRKIKEEHPNTLLRIDCNGSWTLSEALYFAKHFEKDNFEYLEEPVKTIEEIKEFYKRTDFPIALDESLYQNSFSFETLPLSCLILKPTMIGGIKSLMPFVEYAKTIGAKVSFSSSFESGVGLQNILGIASHFRCSCYQGLDTLKFLKNDLLQKPLDVQKNPDKLFIRPEEKNLQKIGIWNLSPALSNKLKNMLLIKQSSLKAASLFRTRN
jgi:O-succinylbenzoate synthase